MDFGLKNRLSRIFSPRSGKTVMLAVDHGYFQGPTTGLRDLRKTVTPLISYADCLFITRGMVRNCIDPKSDTSICLRVSGGSSILGELSKEDVIVSMEEAIRLNAAAVSFRRAYAVRPVRFAIRHNPSYFLRRMRNPLELYRTLRNLIKYYLMILFNTPGSSKSRARKDKA